MIKYVMTAAALKSFSFSPQTKRMYRLLGNIVNQRTRIREGLNTYYLDRAKRILELCERHHAIEKGDRLLEVGTGYVHWESMIIRLFYDIQITMFDVWDNRYFRAFKKYFKQLDEIIDREMDLETMQSEQIHDMLRSLLKASSFEEIYDLLELQYVINPSGTLKDFQNESFAAIFSCDVLEHVDRSILRQYIQDSHRLLKPGGYSIHKIDITDHLYYYDTSVSLKNYLRYSNKAWRQFFENDVQYINKVQRSDWLDLFHKAGFELVEEESIYADIGTTEVDRDYKNLSKQDLECVTLTIVHRKPI